MIDYVSFKMSGISKRWQLRIFCPTYSYALNIFTMFPFVVFWSLMIDLSIIIKIHTLKTIAHKYIKKKKGFFSAYFYFGHLCINAFVQRHYQGGILVEGTFAQWLKNNSVAISP